MDLVIPDVLEYGEPLVLSGSVLNGSQQGISFVIGNNNAYHMSVLCDINQQLNASFDLNLAPGTYEISFWYWTDQAGCNDFLEDEVVIMRPITKLNVSTLPAAAIVNETQVGLALWVDGSHAGLLVDWEDSTISMSPCVSGDLIVVIFSHVYENTGNFTVSGLAANTLTTKEMDNQTIYVQERIRDLAIYGNSSVLTPPGTGIWQIESEAHQLSFENVFCAWDMGTNYGDTEYYIPWLNSSEFHQITFNYIQSDVGTQTVHVNCSNTVSSQNMSMDVNVIWDNVTLGELICNSSTMWNHSITCQLTIVRFGTGACFEWNMGDGKPAIYYQDGYCVAGVPAASPTCVQVFLPSSNRLLQLSFTIFFM